MIKKILSVFVVAATLGACATNSGSSADRSIVFQVNSDDAKLMNLVLNNVENVASAYAAEGKKAEIEVVAYGPGLTMLTAKSPVAARIQNMSSSNENVSFAACGNTMKKMEKKSGKPVQLLEFSSIKVVPAGVVHIVDRQAEGWAYVKP